MTSDVKQMAREMPQYDNIVRNKGILETWNPAFRASTGQHVDHVVNDVIAIFDLVPADGVENARTFIEDYITVYRRIKDRMLDPSELLELVFSSRFVGAVRDHLVLGPYALISNREQPRKNTEELRLEWLRLLGMDGIATKKGDGAVSANLARRGNIISAHMATVDTSLLCGDCCAHANIATVKRPGKRAPPPTMASGEVKVCFNCMGNHLIKDCKAPRSVCSVKGCGEHHHTEAHKFIVNRRLKRKMRMGAANRYPVKNDTGDEIQAHLLQSELDRFSDQWLLWNQDILDHEHAMVATAETGEDSDRGWTEAEKEAFAGCSFFGEPEDFALAAQVDGVIDTDEVHDEATPIDEDDLVALAGGLDAYGVGMITLPRTDSLGLPRYDLFCDEERVDVRLDAVTRKTNRLEETHIDEQRSGGNNQVNSVGASVLHRGGDSEWTPLIGRRAIEFSPYSTVQSTLLHSFQQAKTPPIHGGAQPSDIESQTSPPAPGVVPPKVRARKEWCFNPCAWLGSLLIWIGFMLGGSAASVTSDSVFLNIRGTVSLSGAHCLLARGCPRSEAALARLCCQGSAPEGPESPYLATTCPLSSPIFRNWSYDTMQYQALDKVSLCGYVEISASVANELSSRRSNIAHAYATLVKELDIRLKVVDTGSTHHLFRSHVGQKNIIRLKNLIPVRGITDNPEYIRFIGDHPNPWVGTVCLAPWATADLLRVGQLMENGCSLQETGNKLVIKKAPFGKVLFTAARGATGLFLTSDEEIKAFAELKGHSYVDVDDTMEKLEPDAPEWRLREFIHGHFTRQQRLRAEAAWKLHSSSGHPSRQALGDQCEHGAFEGVKLTRADVENAYKIFRKCHAGEEARFKLPPERASHSPLAPRTGHTLCMDLLQYKVPTLGGNTCVLIAVDEHTGAVFYCQLKRKTAENVEQGIVRIVGALNEFGHRVENIVFDDEAVLKAMEDRLSFRSVNCKYTAAGAHNKRVERTVQELKAKMRCLAADLPYALR
jgi:hypothetical protein